MNKVRQNPCILPNYQFFKILCHDLYVISPLFSFHDPGTSELFPGAMFHASLNIGTLELFPGAMFLVPLNFGTLELGTSELRNLGTLELRNFGT